MARRSIQHLRVAITGCSGGIGRALALELARGGARLVLNARSIDKLTTLADEVRAAGGQAEIAAGDVTDPTVQQAILDAAQRGYQGLDVLVNNAGIGAFGRFDEADAQRLRSIMELNFFSAVELTRAALPLLRASPCPMIVNVSSVIGHRGMPMASEYCASKFALRGFSEALRAELASQHIDVLVVSPGTTKTGFFEHVLEGQEKTPMGQAGGATPQSVARATVRAIARGKHEIVPNFLGRLLIVGNHLAPRVVDWFMQRLVRP